MAAPLFKSERLVALFFVNSAQPRNWRPEEVESVALVASRCWESIERARLTRALLASEERLAISVEAAELGTFFCPVPLGLIIWNAKCKEHFWLPADAEVDFDRFYSIIHKEDRERTRLAVGRAVFHHEPYDIEYRTVAPDGRIRWVRAKGRAYYDATGAPTRFDGVTLDVTALKLVEQRRENMLATERAAREEAERVIRMKDEFLATLSHELRTPLNAILGWSQILTRGPLESEDARQGLQAIERNTRAQAQMIEDLLDMSRITAGKVRLDVGYEPPNLDGIIVLVVDDDSDARGVLARILRDARASVITAASAAEALEILREANPALLISDIGMPGEDGYDLIRKVRALPTVNCGRVPAVALTAFARSEDRQRALLAGYQLHVAKPVEPSELLTVCASLVGRISSPDAS